MIVVTGAAGFIGHHLVRRLLESGQDQVVGLDNLRRGQWTDLRDLAQNGSLRLVEEDIRDSEAIQRVFEGADTIFHLAAQSNVIGAATDIAYSFETNVVGTFNVLRAARAVGVRCVVFASSREVYGEPHVLPVVEDSPLIPKNAYGASKVAGEAYCRIYDTHAMRVVILRLANVYGQGDRDRVIPIFIDQARRRLPLVLYGGKQVLDFVPVDLVVEAFVRAAVTRPAVPINIGTGYGTILEDLAKRILALSGSEAGWQVAPSRSLEVERFVASTVWMRKWLELEQPKDPLELLPSMVQG